MPAIAQIKYVAHFSGTDNPASNVCSQSGAGECKVSARMVWTPDTSNLSEPPAKTAIVSVSGIAGGPGTPSCDDGSGQACTIYQIYLGGHGSVEGPTRYSVKSDLGSSFSIDAKPSAKLPASVTSGSRRVGLFVSATPVVIALVGTTLDASENHHALGGQKISVTLSGGTFTNYSWTVPSETFDAFARGAGHSTGAVVPFTESRLTTDKPYWHWLKGGK